MAEAPNQIDAHVGSRLRLRRCLLGLSQEKLGQAVGLTCRQVQYYEQGTHRIGADRLYQFSRLLDVPPSFFFIDIPVSVLSAPRSEREAALAEAALGEPMSQQETLELLRAYRRIPDKSARGLMFGLMKSLAP